jgi:hypothetical protein
LLAAAVVLGVMTGEVEDAVGASNCFSDSVVVVDDAPIYLPTPALAVLGGTKPPGLLYH